MACASASAGMVPCRDRCCCRRGRVDQVVPAPVGLGRDYSTCAICTMLPLACGSFGSCATVTYKAFLAVAECDVGGAVASGDREFMQ